MNNSLALNVPQSTPALTPYRVALVDIIAGLQAFDIWGRLGWRETRRRYRRTVFGPFWTTVSLMLIIAPLGFVWSHLWHKDLTTYLPYLTSGMIFWIFISGICTEGCPSFLAYEKLIKQLRISYTLLACAVVWRNTVVLFHNVIIYVLVCVVCGIFPTWNTLLCLPGLALLCLNLVWVVIVLGTLCARYRDLQQLVAHVLQISMFLTPIFWTPDQLTGRMGIVAEFNPLYHLIAIVRNPLLGVAPTELNWLAVILITAVGWTTAVLMLTKLRHRIVYWL
jgi:ABC-type polysaccharide/polyol phosphate export permease